MRIREDTRDSSDGPYGNRLSGHSYTVSVQKCHLADEHSLTFPPRAISPPSLTLDLPEDMSPQSVTGGRATREEETALVMKH